MFQIVGKNLMNAFNSLESPMDRVTRSGQIFMFSALANLFGFRSRFFFVCRAEQNNAFFPQGLDFGFVRNIAFEKQASCEPHDRAPLSFLKALVVQKFPRSLSGSVTTFGRLKNLFKSN